MSTIETENISTNKGISPGKASYTHKKSIHRIVTVYVLCIIFLMISSAVTYTYFGRINFVKPAFAEDVRQGFPQVDSKRYAFTPLEVRKGYKIFLCAIPKNDGETVELNLTNPEDNTVWFRTEILDENGNIIGKGGVLKQGQYLQNIKLSTPLTKKETPVSVRIIAYKPEAFTSEGNVSLTIKVFLNYR